MLPLTWGHQTQLIRCSHADRRTAWREGNLSRRDCLNADDATSHHLCRINLRFIHFQFLFCFLLDKSWKHKARIKIPIPLSFKYLSWQKNTHIIRVSRDFCSLNLAIKLFLSSFFSWHILSKRNHVCNLSTVVSHCCLSPNDRQMLHLVWSFSSLFQISNCTVMLRNNVKPKNHGLPMY